MAWTLTSMVRQVTRRVVSGEIFGKTLNVISPTSPEVMLPHTPESASQDPLQIPNL